MVGKKAGLGILLAALLAAAVVAPAAAQSQAGAAVGLVRTGTGSFSLDVDGADLRTVLRAISESSGRNIVLGSSAKAVVRIQLKNVAWQDALKAVLRASSLDYVEDGSVIRVDDAAKLNAEKVERETANARTLELVPLQTRIVKLNYENAQELAAPLTATLSKRGLVQVEKRTNSLIITDLPSNLDGVAQMAAQLDSQTPQIEITLWVRPFGAFLPERELLQFLESCKLNFLPSVLASVSTPTKRRPNSSGSEITDRFLGDSFSQARFIHRGSLLVSSTNAGCFLRITQLGNPSLKTLNFE